jgi:hypothetical protein
MLSEDFKVGTDSSVFRIPYRLYHPYRRHDGEDLLQRAKESRDSIIIR